MPPVVKDKTLGPDTVGRVGSILIADEANFTRTMLTRGPAAALKNIWTIRRLLIPILRAGGGEVYKVAADNLYAFYPSPEEALGAALGAHRVLAAETRRATEIRGAEEETPLQVGIGIGFGELLYLPSEDDYYGVEVNLASKLGEDVACGGGTLLTRAAAAAVTSAVSGRPGRRRRLRISDVVIHFQEWIDEDL